MPRMYKVTRAGKFIATLKAAEVDADPRTALANVLQAPMSATVKRGYVYRRGNSVEQLAPRSSRGHILGFYDFEEYTL